MQNNKVYSKLTKPMRYPKGLKEFIYNTTDYKTNKTLKVSRFVSFIEMCNGLPLQRIFGFISKNRKRDMKSMLVKEVARNYDNHQWLGDIYCSCMGGYKYPCYEYKIDGFSKIKGKWYFAHMYSMTEPLTFLQEQDIKYSGWSYKSELDFVDYITHYLKNNKCELLMKSGLEYWTKHLRLLDTSKKSIHEVFKIKQECVPLLKDERFRYKQLLICRKYGYTTMNEIDVKMAILLGAQRHHEFKEILDSEETLKYIIKSNITYVSDYYDYLKDLKELGAINDPKALYPKNYIQAHKKATTKIKIKKSKYLVDGFKKSYKKYKKYEYDNSKFMIIAVSTPEQLYKESEVLDHCVRAYDRDVADGKTEIMFIRKSNKANKPFYTLELSTSKKVIQVRGKENCDPTDKIKDFVREWADIYKIKYNPKYQEY